MKVELYRIDRGHWQHIVTATTNADGRTYGPILPSEAFLIGQYELPFTQAITCTNSVHLQMDQGSSIKSPFGLGSVIAINTIMCH